VEQFLARLWGTEEILAVFADQCRINWVQSPGVIHHVAGHRLFRQPEVQRLQKYVVKQLKRPYWVNTELYSTAQIQQYETTNAPYQTIISE
jgi:hypothetical protein